MDPTIIATASHKIADLLSILSKKAKDRETAALVQQIQAQQQIVHTALHEEHSKSLRLEREIFEMEKTHTKQIGDLTSAHRAAIAERDDKIRQLQATPPPPEQETEEDRRYNELMRGMNAGG